MATITRYVGGKLKVERTAEKKATHADRTGEPASQTLFIGEVQTVRDQGRRNALSGVSRVGDQRGLKAQTSSQLESATNSRVHFIVLA